MIVVLHEQSNRRACGFTTHHATKDLHSVFLDLHASTRAVTLLTAGEFFVDNVWGEGKPGGDAIKNGGQ